MTHVPAVQDRPVTGLVARARRGDQQAWDTLVERYAPSVWSICRRHGLAGADAADVGENVWRQLVDHLAELRDPDSIGAARRRCLDKLRRHPAIAALLNAESAELD